jgi:hypothetical protein
MDRNVFSFEESSGAFSGTAVADMVKLLRDVLRRGGPGRLVAEWQTKRRWSVYQVSLE